MSISSNSPGQKGNRAKRVFHPDGSPQGAIRPPVGTVHSAPQVPGVRPLMPHQSPSVPLVAQPQQPQPLPQQPKSRIDPNQIPSPIQVQDQDQQLFAGQEYGTCSKTSVPLSTTQVRVVDQGNCNPRFMRINTTQIPINDDLVEKTHIPMSLIVQPLAQLRPDEDPVPVIEMQKEGPVRCRRCKGYLNPWCLFADGGRKFVCNLCGFDSDVPDEYFCNLDMTGRRTDYEYRPELRYGTVEYIVPEEYWAKKPHPIRYLFAIDVSSTAVQSGMLASVCQSLNDILYGDHAGNGLPEGAKIGLVTFDRSIHFYNLKATLDQAQMIVVSDVQDVFVPLHDGLFVDPEESKTVIQDLLANLPNFYAETRVVDVVFGSIIATALSGMQEGGGKLTVFSTSIPKRGLGVLQARAQVNNNSDEEKSLLLPIGTAYNTWGVDLVNAGICVDLWFFPARTLLELTTVSQLASMTGGDIHYFPNFNPIQDTIKITHDLRHGLVREAGYNAVMRIRCSNGLTIHQQFGNFHMKNSTDIELAGIDQDKAVAFIVKHDEKLDTKLDASFQCAMLYTTATGQRRVRVINLSLPVTDNIGNVFRSAQMDVTLNLLMKQAITLAGSKSTQALRDELADKCVKILSAYRKHCALSSSPGQLILPDSFKLLPLFTLGMLKSIALKSNPNLNIDTRVHQMKLTKSLGILDQMVLLYPRLIPISHLAPEHGQPDASGNIQLPSSMRSSYERLLRDHAYLLENGQDLYIWLGRDISSDYLQAVFGTDDLQHVDPRQNIMPTLDTALSRQTRDIIGAIQAQRAWKMPVHIVRQQLDMELEFANLLTEDKNNEQMSYVDYLCVVHRQIQTEITQEKQDNIMASASYWTHRF